jgi:hypothetical protein
MDSGYSLEAWDTYRFVIWDRRTALAPAIRKNKELEERKEVIKKTLIEWSFYCRINFMPLWQGK